MYWKGSDLNNNNNKNLKIPVTSKNTEQADGSAKKITDTLEALVVASYKGQHSIAIWSSNHTPRYLPNYFGNLNVCTKMCTEIFIPTLFRIAQSGNKPTCPSIGEQINCGTSTQWNIIQR